MKQFPYKALFTYTGHAFPSYLTRSGQIVNVISESTEPEYLMIESQDGWMGAAHINELKEVENANQDG